MSERKIFVTSDLHFSHEAVLKYNNRPWKNVLEMNDALIENWNRKVNKRDTVIIVGDFAWERHGYFLNVLNGKKELVIGSHDKMPKKYLDSFSNVYMTKTFDYKKRTFVAMHCCPRVWEKSHYGSICLFGHSHGRLNTYNLSFDVGVDVPQNRYSPINMDEILERVSVREAQMERAGRIKIEERERNGKKSKFKIFYQDDLAYFNPDLARVKIDMEGY